MATKSTGGTCSCPHHKTFGWIILIIGALYLLNDLGWWNVWVVNWWTAAFVLIGLGALCSCCDKGKCF